MIIILNVPTKIAPILSTNERSSYFCEGTLSQWERLLHFVALKLDLIGQSILGI